VLGLELRVEGTRLRFLHGGDLLPDADELIAKLGAMVDDLSTRHRADAERTTDLERRLATEAQRATTEAQRATTEAQRADTLEKQLAAVREENERLKSRR
jgi:uncharacterized protein involved in exopolysaccharide biosynthesis